MPSIVIIGGGPAGLSAAIYTARANIQTTVLYQHDGALGKADKIENYFGFADVISGPALLAQGRAQATRLGAQIIQTEVTGIEYAEKGFVVKSTNGTFPADAVLLATGAPRTAPPIPGVQAFEGRGVSYCAICDAFFYRGKSVAVLGEGEYALEEARVLLPVASSVTLLTNGASPVTPLPDGLHIDARPIAAITGGDTVEQVTFTEGEALPVSGAFIAYGTAGSSDFARKLGAQLDGNKIQVAENRSTAVPGLFAAGDCTGGLLQIAKAVSDGAIAAMSAIKFVRK